MKRRILFLLLLFLFFVSPVLAQEKIKIYFFYGEGCPHCARANKFLEIIQEKYPTKVEIIKYEIYSHPENIEIFKDFCLRHNIQPNAVPTIFVGEKYFRGWSNDIGLDLEGYIKQILEEGKNFQKENAFQNNFKKESFTQLTLTKIFSLALVDAVNPCALAVLTLMLISILAYNPHKKRNIILAGFSFVAAVFIMYLLYGLIIIRFFQIVQSLTFVRLLLYKILGATAVILGILNIKDFLKYKPGSLFTEMPMFLRPKVKKVISGITSPRGAFFIGLFVTLFLLPCTIGPYIITGGILSALEIVKTIPYLLFYNLIFVLPMVVIVFIVYFSMAKIEDVSDWKDRNIRFLHLIAGIIIFCLGLMMILGI